MADIILIQPKIGIEGYSTYGLVPPWGLIYSAMLVDKEYEVKIIDQRLDRNWRRTLQIELGKKPLFIGITSKVGGLIKHSLEISKFIKDRSDVPVVWGGPFASIMPRETIENENVNIVVIGEGEVTLYELAKALEKGKSLKGVKGIWYKDKKGIHSNPQRKFIDLNTLPDIPYHLVDFEDYIFDIDGLRTIYVISSRGCPRRCGFCYNSVFNRNIWRGLSPNGMIDMMSQFVEKFNVQRFMFLDDHIDPNHNRLNKLAQGILKKRMKIKWSAYLDVNHVKCMNESTIKLLLNSGLYAIFIGLESGSQTILDNINKGITVEQTIKVNRTLLENGIIPYYFAMAGFPGETETDLQETRDLLLRVIEENPLAQILTIHSFTPYCGTTMGDAALRNGFKMPEQLIDYKDFGGHKVISPWLSNERKRELETLIFLTNFIDDKWANKVKNRFLGGIIRSYGKVARYRFRNRDYRIMLELTLCRLYQSIVNR